MASNLLLLMNIVENFNESSSRLAFFAFFNSPNVSEPIEIGPLKLYWQNNECDDPESLLKTEDVTPNPNGRFCGTYKSSHLGPKRIVPHNVIFIRIQTIFPGQHQRVCKHVNAHIFSEISCHTKSYRTGMDNFESIFVQPALNRSKICGKDHGWKKK